MLLTGVIIRHLPRVESTRLLITAESEFVQTEVSVCGNSVAALRKPHVYEKNFSHPKYYRGSILLTN